jgi:hypothetical protein
VADRKDDKYKPRHARGKRGEEHEQPSPVIPEPGTAGMAQGQPDAGVEPDDSRPEQADNLVTGAEALEEQQKNPELDDKGTARGA